VSFVKPRRHRSLGSSNRSLVDMVAKRVSQTGAVLSSEAVTMWYPSGLKAAEFTPGRGLAQDREFLGGGGVPDARGVSRGRIPARRNQDFLHRNRPK
jgi:hypothetical protein